MGAADEALHRLLLVFRRGATQNPSRCIGQRDFGQKAAYNVISCFYLLLGKEIVQYAFFLSFNFRKRFPAASFIALFLADAR